MGITVLIARYLGEKKPEYIGAGHWRWHGGVCADFCGAVCYYGAAGAADFGADAGPGGGG